MNTQGQQTDSYSQCLRGCQRITMMMMMMHHHHDEEIETYENNDDEIIDDFKNVNSS